MKLVWGDWSSIEARTLPWLSNQPAAQKRLDLFAACDADPELPDVYQHTAADITGKRPEDVDEDQRQSYGKVPDLSLGFQGGAGALLKMARAYGVSMSDGNAERVKVRWREANLWAVDFWADTQETLFHAMKYGEAMTGRVLLYRTETPDELVALLPGGTRLSYPYPRIDIIEKWEKPTRVVTSLKSNWKPKQDDPEWPRVQLYGGLCCENFAQAMAAALLKKALRRLDAADWPVIMHTHDDIVLRVENDEVDDAAGALREAMLAREDWMAGLPMAVEIKVGDRFGVGKRIISS